MTRRRPRHDPNPAPPSPAVVCGARIREFRLALDMTQADLARSCFVHQVTVSEWERGAKVPSPRGRPSRRDLVAMALGRPTVVVFAEVIAAEAAGVAS